MKKVLLLGASGSIGSQTLDIIAENPNDFVLTGFSVGHKSEKVEEILEKFPSVKMVYHQDKLDKKLLKKYKQVKFLRGKNKLLKLVKKCDYDICVDALVGFVGMEPAIIVLERNKILCLANKEALVAGGTIISSLVVNHKGKIYPIDSEHVALAKCLSKCDPVDVDKIIITASGGALRDIPLENLANVKKEDALKHPTWKMGDKITIDSATMMNKGFEIIEAYYLFGFGLDQIEVLMHDESLIHSGVKLNDGTYILDYGKPDMHNPIKWALYEGKCDYEVIHVKSLDELKDCHFRVYDPKRYKMTELAKQCLKAAASYMIGLNAANEIAVNRFLKDEIGYLDIYKTVLRVVKRMPTYRYPTLKEIKKLDESARRAARK